MYVVVEEKNASLSKEQRKKKVARLPPLEGGHKRELDKFDTEVIPKTTAKRCQRKLERKRRRKVFIPLP